MQLAPATLVLGLVFGQACASNASATDHVSAAGAAASGASSGGTAATSGGSGAGSGDGGAAGGKAGASPGEPLGGAGGEGQAGMSPEMPDEGVEKLSFFLTSLRAMQWLSKNEAGFGGDLRFGETGMGAGLRGADKICAAIAERSAPGNGRVWRAFLSATQGDDGEPVNASDRIGDGPWYDRAGRLVAQNKADLLHDRPVGADAAIINDLPNEDGVPNHRPDPTAPEVDNHDVLTGTNVSGELFSLDAHYTCSDWTTTEGSAGEPLCGHSWPRQLSPGVYAEHNWMGVLLEAGCAPGAWVVENGPPGANGTQSVGDGGGYGGIYCFALPR
jgi:hypothetical protein